ncbi:putative transmembrane protein [Gregarina niphandrodes]|uniref:Transmembrane protein n=1 Tax=Gregarina niphandrodes TaxID=110365 RepID=A0A023B6L2_GRENI|nr:putative transmembrane protein [Gregarina niphandrodes]EZG66628.1 putative transmembrane protein [Gregarina niphandrodes]|eukprot:XP_011130557.1 putative transmembrane protein [Gregarina niphandrodes]
MFDIARPLHSHFINLCLIIQSVPMSLLWVRQPHILVWLLFGLIPLFENTVGGDALAFSMAVMMIYGVVPINHKLVTTVLIVANIAAWLFKTVRMVWQEYYASNSNISFIAGGGATMGLALSWIWIYSFVHKMVFYEQEFGSKIKTE